MTDDFFLPEFINKRDICRLLGVGRPLVDAMILDDTFPMPVSFTKRAMWSRAAVMAWVAAR